jgi:hypothetical protein
MGWILSARSKSIITACVLGISLCLASNSLAARNTISQNNFSKLSETQIQTLMKTSVSKIPDLREFWTLASSNPEFKNVYIMGGVLRGLIVHLNQKLSTHSYEEILKLPVPSTDQLLLQNADKDILNLTNGYVTTQKLEEMFPVPYEIIPSTFYQNSVDIGGTSIEKFAVNPFGVNDPYDFIHDLREGTLSFKYDPSKLKKYDIEEGFSGTQLILRAIRYKKENGFLNLPSNFEKMTQAVLKTENDKFYETSKHKYMLAKPLNKIFKACHEDFVDFFQTLKNANVLSFLADHNIQLPDQPGLKLDSDEIGDLIGKLKALNFGESDLTAVQTLLGSGSDFRMRFLVKRLDRAQTLSDIEEIARLDPKIETAQTGHRLARLLSLKSFKLSKNLSPVESSALDRTVAHLRSPEFFYESHLRLKVAPAKSLVQAITGGESISPGVAKDLIKQKKKSPKFYGGRTQFSDEAVERIYAAVKKTLETSLTIPGDFEQLVSAVPFNKKQLRSLLAMTDSLPSQWEETLFRSFAKNEKIRKPLLETLSKPFMADLDRRTSGQSSELLGPIRNFFPLWLKDEPAAINKIIKALPKLCADGKIPLATNLFIEMNQSPRRNEIKELLRPLMMTRFQNLDGASPREVSLLLATLNLNSSEDRKFAEKVLEATHLTDDHSLKEMHFPVLGLFRVLETSNDPVLLQFMKNHLIREYEKGRVNPLALNLWEERIATRLGESYQIKDMDPVHWLKTVIRSPSRYYDSVHVRRPTESEKAEVSKLLKGLIQSEKPNWNLITRFLSKEEFDSAVHWPDLAELLKPYATDPEKSNPVPSGGDASRSSILQCLKTVLIPALQIGR